MRRSINLTKVVIFGRIVKVIVHQKEVIAMPRFWVCVDVGRMSKREDDVYEVVDASDWNEAAEKAEQAARQRPEFAGWRMFRAVEMALRE